MSDNRLGGAVKEGVGKVQDTFGGLTGDAGTQARGKLNEAGGSAQNAVGKVQDQAGDIYETAEGYIKDQPGLAAAVILGAGIVIGLILRGGRKTVYVRK